MCIRGLFICTALVVLVGTSGLATPAAAQNIEVRSTQLELGIDAAVPLAPRRYERGVLLGGGITARFALTRGRFVFDAGFMLGYLGVNETWYMGDAHAANNPWIARVRAMVGMRYALVTSEHVQLYSRLGFGLESRIAVFDHTGDDGPSEPRERALSWAPVIEPSIGLRLGGGHHFALLQVAVPIALHREAPIRIHGSRGSDLAVDLSASIFVGFTL